MEREIRLNNGVRMPRVGLGVFRAGRGEVPRAAVAEALRVGYRHVDTARIYGNEADVGQAVRESGLPRSDVFVTTKLWNEDHGYDRALRAYDASERRLGLGAVDLFLLHWPVPERRRDSWRALERLLADGRVRSIGVSNYMAHHLRELLDHATVLPAVNQVELHPFHQQREAVEVCRANGIAVQAYCPLTRAARLGDPAVAAVARRVGRTPAQVLVRWSLQRGFVPLPKSTHADRIAQNFAVWDFDLDDAAMAALDALDEGLAVAWDPRGEE